MAYAEFWSKDTDKYAENDPKYGSTLFSLVEETNFSFSNLVKVTPSSSHRYFLILCLNLIGLEMIF